MYHHRDKSLEAGYWRLISCAQSVNQQNAVNIAFDDRMSAIERQELISILKRKLSSRREVLNGAHPCTEPRGRPGEVETLRSNLEDWLRHFRYHQKLAGRPKANSLKRRFSTSHLSFYAAGNQGSRELIIGWTGRSRRLMMPVANYLPAFADRKADLLLVSPNRRTGYRGHLGRLGSDLSEAVNRINELVERLRPSAVRVIGTSLGAVPALYSAVLLRADSCSIVGLSGPSDNPQRLLLEKVKTLWSGIPLRDRPQLAFTYGVEAEADAIVARELAVELGGKEFPVPKSGHSMVWNLFRRRLFRRWLNETLFQTSI